MNKLIALAALAATAAAQCDGSNTGLTLGGGGMVDCTGVTVAGNDCTVACTAIGGVTGSATGTFTCTDNSGTLSYVPSVPAPSCPCVGAVLGGDLAAVTNASAATCTTAGACTPTCNAGYTASTTNLLTCATADASAAGTYTNAGTVCEKDGCSGTAPTGDDGFAAITATCTTATEDGDECTYACDTTGSTVGGDGTIKCVVTNGVGAYVKVGDRTCAAAAATPCKGDVPVGASGIMNGTATCAGAGSCTVMCAEGYTKKELINLTCAIQSDASVYSSGAIVCEKDICSGLNSDAPEISGVTSDCSKVKADEAECVLTCVDSSQTLTAGTLKCTESTTAGTGTYVVSATAPTCAEGGAMADSMAGSVTLTDDEFEKAGCKVREADVTKYDGASPPEAFAAALKAAGSAAAIQLQLDMVLAVKLGNQVSEAAYKLAVGDKTLTEAQVTLIKKRYCVGSNFVTAAVALAVAFVLAK